MRIELMWTWWKIYLAFRIKWDRPTVFTFFLLEWVENENAGVLWLAFMGVFIGLGIRKFVREEG